MTLPTIEVTEPMRRVREALWRVRHHLPLSALGFVRTIMPYSRLQPEAVAYLRQLRAEHAGLLGPDVPSLDDDRVG